MARQVDGMWLPDRVSGHAALELNNTVGGWGFAQPREYLADYRVLVTLARDVGLVDAADSFALLTEAQHRPGAARAVLREARRLRAVMHATLTDGAVADELYRFVAAAVRASRYVEGDTVAFHLDGGTGLRMPLHRFALSLHSLLERHPRRAIRACADERCGWLFLDPSGRRRWCEMAVCGNRAKARRYARRRRTG